MELLLGIDLGTTHLKAATFTLDGRLNTLELSRAQGIVQGPGQEVYQPEQLWESVVKLLQLTVRRLAPATFIRSIAVASMAEAGLFVDKNGAPLTEIMVWHDARGRKMMEEWYAQISPADCFSITGLNYNYIYSLFKILWLKRSLPRIMDSAAKWLCVPDFINYRLTGEFATDYSIASRTMLFDINKRSWSETMLGKAGLEARLLPDVRPSGQVIGALRPHVAELTGLPVGTPVSLAGHDHICAAFAANITKPGQVLDSIGTSESIVAAFDLLPRLDLSSFGGFNLGCHVIPNQYYLHGSMHAAGASLEWFLKELADPALSRERMIDKSRSSTPGSQGVFFIPHLRGSGPPVRSPSARACFLGIRDYHSQADLARSVYEGICLEARAVLESMEQILRITFHDLHAVGGGAKNEFWMELKSAILGRALEVPAVQEATLLGAALLGGIGAKIYADYNDAVRASYRAGLLYHPDKRTQEQYSDVYGLYSRLLPLVREIGRIIS